MKRILSAAAMAVVTALPAHADPAEQCKLPLLASLKLKLVGGIYTVPVTINGVEHDFQLGLNASFSAISGALTDAQGFKDYPLPHGFTTQVNGDVIAREVTVPDVSLGVAHANDFKMLRADKAFSGSGIDGLLGLDMLTNFDAELDLNSLKLNLFSHNDCRQKAYWASRYAVVPFTKDAIGHISFSTLMDDQKVTADIDVTEGPSTIASNTVRRIFDLTLQSPGMTSETVNGHQIWHYPFGQLSIGGIVVSNPRIDILPYDGPECRPNYHVAGGHFMACYGSSEMQLHGPSLKALRLYFAFKDNMLYVTAADAHS